METLPIKLTEMVSAVMAMMVVLIPVIGLVIRLAAKPVVEALVAASGEGARPADLEALKTRIEALEHLEAHFKQPTGASRPGIDWTIGIKRGPETHRVRVRSYFAEDMSPAVKADTTYLGRTVMQYLDDLLR